MFRAAILTVVLLFAAMPGASLLCRAWCDPHVAAADGCHQRDSGGTTAVRGDGSCDDSVRTLAGLLKEELRRAPAVNGGAVLQAARFLTHPTAPPLVRAWNQGRRLSSPNEPQTTPLRI